MTVDGASRYRDCLSTEDTIRTTLLDYIRREFKRPALEAGDPLLEGNVDSLGLFNLVGFIEVTFQVLLDDSELTVENFADVDTLTRVVHGHLPAATAAP